MILIPNLHQFSSHEHAVTQSVLKYAVANKLFLDIAETILYGKFPDSLKDKSDKKNKSDAVYSVL